MTYLLNSKYFKIFISIISIFILSLFVVLLQTADVKEKNTIYFIIALTSLNIGLLILKHYNTKSYKDKVLSYQKALEDSGLFAILDENLYITYANQKFKEITKIKNLKKPIHFFELFPNKKEEISKNQIKKEIKEQNHYHGIIKIKGEKDKIYIISASIYPFFLNKKNSHGYIFFGINISKHIETEKKLKELIYIDYITNLPNRLKLIEDLKQRNPHKSSMILIDIDSLGMYSEYFGVDAGDCILSEITQWLYNKLPTKEAKLYKVDSTIFGIFINSALSYNELRDYLKLLNSNIKRETFFIKDKEVSVTFTIGAALNTDKIFKHAFQVLKKAKNEKKPYEIFSFNPSLENISKQNIYMINIIKKAIDTNDIIPYFQPIQNIQKGEIEKFESLIRIRHGSKILSPQEFIPIAIQRKLYSSLTRMMIKKCFEMFHRRYIEFSINISTKDIINKKTANFIIDKLIEYNLGSWVIFEILESDDIKNTQEIYDFIKRAKALGVRIAIDDFGSGYSNFDHILKLQIDYIKIDGSLIKHIDTNEDAKIIIQTIVKFAKALDIKTIAEFVSSKKIYDTIKELGVDYAQGYHIGPPNPSIDMYLKGYKNEFNKRREKFTFENSV